MTCKLLSNVTISTVLVSFGPDYLMAKAAAKVTNVVLNGEGGDPCFGGPKNTRIFNKAIGAAPSTFPQVPLVAIHIQPLRGWLFHRFHRWLFTLNPKGHYKKWGVSLL
jgi:asparagine synthetase B (glutamine-hydrolysing)